MPYAFLLLVCLGLTADLSADKSVKPPVQPVVVLELFTSQGCSSCPPADRALQAIVQQAARSGQAVYGLAFHVDYWDRLGWQDPFSAREYTDWQRQYDRQLKSQTYTPQLVINGQQELVGGQRGRIDQAIQAIISQPTSQFVGVTGKLTRQAKQVTVEFSLSASGPYRVNVALIQKEAQTAVRNGENGGRTLVNTDIVRQFKTIDAPSLSGSVVLPLPTGLSDEESAVVVYVQRKDNGHIVGATTL